MPEADSLSELVDAVRENPRYRNISEDLIRSIGAQELLKRANMKQAVKSTRSKLHQVGGAYLDSKMPFGTWEQELDELPRSAQEDEVQQFCERVMAKHASTRERLPIWKDFFQRTLAAVQPVNSVLDLACGLNPLALAAMPLADDAVYYACDIYEDMLSFVSRFLDHCSVENHVTVCDLTSQIPQQPVQVAFLLKTIPCLEQIDKHIGPRLLDTINAEHLLVSFPTRSLGGKQVGMAAYYGDHFSSMVEGRGWTVRSYPYEEELAFLVSR